jgi:hypothetical protein
MTRFTSKVGQAMRSTLCLLLCASCGGDDEHGDPSSVNDTSVNTSTSANTTTASTAAGTQSDPDDDSTSSASSATSATSAASTTTRPTSGSPTEPCSPFGDETGSNALTGDKGFAFADTPYCDYDQIDRVGIPMVIDLVIVSKDDYKTTNPAGDMGVAFDGEVQSSIIKLRNTLVTAITNAGLSACSTLQIQCQQQATKLVFPDLLFIATEGAAGFQEGRRLDTPMPDRVLAQLLLDLDAHDVETFADLPLNPAENDVPFPDDWPYLAQPH